MTSPWHPRPNNASNWSEGRDADDPPSFGAARDFSDSNNGWAEWHTFDEDASVFAASSNSRANGNGTENGGNGEGEGGLSSEGGGAAEEENFVGDLLIEIPDDNMIDPPRPPQMMQLDGDCKRTDVTAAEKAALSSFDRFSGGSGPQIPPHMAGGSDAQGNAVKKTALPLGQIASNSDPPEPPSIMRRGYGLERITSGSGPLVPPHMVRGSDARVVAKRRTFLPGHSTDGRGVGSIAENSIYRPPSVASSEVDTVEYNHGTGQEQAVYLEGGHSVHSTQTDEETSRTMSTTPSTAPPSPSTLSSTIRPPPPSMRDPPPITNELSEAPLFYPVEATLVRDASVVANPNANASVAANPSESNQQSHRPPPETSVVHAVLMESQTGDIIRRHKFKIGCGILLIVVAVGAAAVAGVIIGLNNNSPSETFDTSPTPGSTVDTTPKPTQGTNGPRATSHPANSVPSAKPTQRSSAHSTKHPSTSMPASLEPNSPQRPSSTKPATLAPTTRQPASSMPTAKPTPPPSPLPTSFAQTTIHPASSKPTHIPTQWPTSRPSLRTLSPNPTYPTTSAPTTRQPASPMPTAKQTPLPTSPQTIHPTPLPTPLPSSLAPITNQPSGSDPTKSLLKIELQTDEYGFETSWTLHSIDTETNTPIALVDEAKEDFYISHQQDSWEELLSPGKYRFALKDRYGDGFCCSNGKGWYRVSVNDRELISGDRYQNEISHDIIIGYDPEMKPRDKEWLNAHNTRREEWHGSHGKTYEPLLWSKGLAENATSWARELIKDCRTALEEGILEGENIAKNTGGPAADGQMYPADTILRRWVEQQETRGYPRNQQLTQVLWRATRYLGCGEAERKNDNGTMCRVQVCRYARAGNCAMNSFNADEGDNWLIPMLMDKTACGPDCPPEGCF
mmetsp:Transcript_11646/g.20256  ORF Transcript_11646/g.20256 Transcript_11646/m.20256 type:complete len:904 (-) Transcript_11646:203-2914(-)